jgi:hypothetical protein
MSNELQFYNEAKAALAKAKQVDEVKQIHDKAAAIKAATKVAKDKDLEADAHEIRVRAERRLGELMEQQKQTEGFNKSGGDQRSDHRDSAKPGGNAKPTLAEAGINKNLAHRARAAAKPSDQEFEQKVTAEKEQIKSPEPKTVRPQQVEQSMEERRAINTKLAEGDAPLPPLSMSAQQKLEAWERAYRKKLDADFEKVVCAEYVKRLNEVLPKYKLALELAEATIKARKGIMDDTTFKLIWSCLHPDSRGSVTEEKLSRAFRALEKYRVLMVKEKEMPTPSFASDLPSSWEELEEAKRKATEKRKAKREESKQTNASARHAS